MALSITRVKKGSRNFMFRLLIMCTCTLILPVSVCFSLVAKAPPAASTPTVTAGNTPDLGIYQWTTLVPMIKCDSKGTPLSPSSVVISEPGQKFVIVDATTANVTIKILTYSRDNSEQSFFKYNYDKGSNAFYTIYVEEDTFIRHFWFINRKKNRKQRKDALRDSKRKIDDGNYGDGQIYFQVSVTNLLKYATKYEIVKTELAFGIVNFPIKFRPQQSKQDYSGAFNLNLALGISFPHKMSSDWTFSLVGAIGVTNISLDTSVVSAFRIRDNPLQAGNSHEAVTFSIGGLVQYQKIQAGVFIGADRLSNLEEQQYDWKYQGKPWISVAFGYSVFTPQKAEVSTTQEQ